MAFKYEEVNELNTLEAFDKHGPLSWVDFTLQEIFPGISARRPEAARLRELIDQFEAYKFIAKIEGPAPPQWQITEDGKQRLAILLKDREANQAKLKDQEEKAQLELEHLRKQLLHLEGESKRQKKELSLQRVAIIIALIEPASDAVKWVYAFIKGLSS